MVLTKKDEEATGNGYLEVARNSFDEINGLYWIPSITVRRTSEARCGWVQMKGEGEKEVYFKDFGDKRIIDSRTGLEFGLDTEGELTDETVSSEEIEEHSAYELIHFKIPTISNTIYGIPRHAAATPAITGNRLVDERNVALFRNEAVPKFAVIVEGGSLNEHSRQAIENFWNASLKGPDKVGRTIILQAEVKKTAINRESNVRIKLEPLTIGVTEDASFQIYKSANNKEISESFGISPVFFELTDINRASGDVGRQITSEQTFEPEAHRREHLLFLTIIRDVVCRPFSVSLAEAKTKGQEIITSKSNNSLFGSYAKEDNPFKAFIEKMRKEHYCHFIKKTEQELLFETEPLVRIRFNRSTTQDLVNQATVDEKLAKWGAITPNDMRKRFGLPPYPQEPRYVWADLPLPVVVVLANRGWNLGVMTDEPKGSADSVGDENQEKPEQITTPEEESEGGKAGDTSSENKAASTMLQEMIKGMYGSNNV